MPVVHSPEEDVTFFSTVVFPRARVWLYERVGPALSPSVRVGWTIFTFIPTIRVAAWGARF